MAFYVTGIPRMTCKSWHIFKLFYSVAQVKHINLNTEEGWAEVVVYDRNSIEFIKAKTWSLNGSPLTILDSWQSGKEIFQKSTVTKSILKTPYQAYQKKANLFWRDIPHDAACMKKKRLKIKRKMISLKDHQNMKEEDHRKRGKRKKRVNHRQLRDTHSKKLSLDQFCENLQNMIKEIEHKHQHLNGRCLQNHHTEKKIGVPHCSDFTTIAARSESVSNYSTFDVIKIHPNLIGNELNTSHNLKNGLMDRNVVLLDVEHSTDMQVTSLRKETPIPVYLKYRNHYIPVNIKLTCTLQLKRLIYHFLQIPPEFQLVTYKGKVIDGDTKLSFQPYDNIHVQVKSKGGMQKSSDITPKSSESEVETWLKVTVGLSEEVFGRYVSLHDLDGDTLLSYPTEEYLIKDTNVSVGVARRIFLHLENKVIKTENNLKGFTAKDVAAFMRSKIKNTSQKMMNFFAEVIKRDIDGFVFFHYKSGEDFRADFCDLDIEGMYFNKIILKRNGEFFQQAEKETPMPVDACPAIDKDTLKHSESLPISSNRGIHEQLRQILHLVPCENQNDDVKECKFRIIHGSWTKANELEKKFVFFVICDLDEFFNTEQQKELWYQIKRNTSLWLQEIDSSERELFKEHNGAYFYQNREIQFSSQCRMINVMDKSIEAIKKRDSHILIVTKKLLKERSSCSCGYIANLTVNRDKNERFSFAFGCKSKYFLFNSEECSEGFQPKNMPIEKPGVSCKSVNPVGNNSKKEGRKDIESKQVTKLNTDQLESGKLQLQSESRPIPPLHSKENEKQRQKIECAAENTAITIHDKYMNEKLQQRREFKCTAETLTYHTRCSFIQPEDDGTLLPRCFEYKSLFTNSNKEKRIVAFQYKMLEFACGCLNARTNGTIYFGVADSNVENGQYTHGEIVGIDITEKGNDSRTSYTDARSEGISKCFTSDVVSIASKCISNPIFVKVNTNDQNIKFVIEVDIMPQSEICGDHYFKVNVHNLKNLKNEPVPNRYTLYVRYSRLRAETVALSTEQEKTFILTELKDFIKCREENEKKEIEKLKINMIKVEEDGEKLERLLTRGTFKFNNSIWPLLVLGKPTDEQKQNEGWTKDLSFLKQMRFKGIFDFDDRSNEDGLCAHFRNEENSKLEMESLFRQNTGNFQELANKLGIPHDEKTLWIFSNGRSDHPEQKPHYSRCEWHSNYSAGVCNAISFFNQPFVIPSGRAMIMILLFSDEFDGLVDTFNEISRNFGWGPIVIISEKKEIFDIFSDFIIGESKGTKKQLDDVSIVGMPWDHVNSVLADLLDFTEKRNCYVPSSSGTFIAVEERVHDFLTDLEIVSAKQCENNKKLTKDLEFRREQELQFYKGGRVTWWNFYFASHVCTRHRFDYLYKRIHKILLNSKFETRKIVTMTIAHEPGAGATTLGRHLLWQMRRIYRCALIKKITGMTVQQITSFWKYREQNHPKPVLLLLDDLIQSEMDQEEFIRQLNLEFRKSELNDGMNCLMLICQRVENLTSDESDHENLIFIKQNLVKEEKEWFFNKYDELEHRGEELSKNEYNPKNLISFMIMRSDFNEEYIHNTIQHLISNLDIFKSEYKLLKYVALLSAFTPPTKRGIKAFVPLECCDELMGMKFWEHRMSTALNILLIIEQREEAGGLQIRMAHPNLGKALLNEAMKREDIKLEHVALDFFNSSLINNLSYAKKTLIDFAIGILKRRMKEEYDDEKTTDFSPLVEGIIRGPEENYEKASEVLTCAYKHLQDSAVAQTLARIYSKMGKHDDAIKWAKDSVDLSSDHSKLYCLHTLGVVLRTKFKANVLNNVFFPESAVPHLDVILQSLDAFLQAQQKREFAIEGYQRLYPYQDTILTINVITNFIFNNIKYEMQLADIKHYLKDKDFIPPEINIIWKKFHIQIKNMQNRGKEAFAVLENDLCFYTTFYSRDQVSRHLKNVKEHRFYRVLDIRYPNLFQNFSNVYGEDPQEDLPKTPAVRDLYLRRNLLSLKGNSYMNIFSHLREITNRATWSDTAEHLLQIKKRLTDIEYKESTDFANLVSVNMALGLVGGKQRDSENEILKMCKKIISAQKELIDLAYLFVSMLLWPSAEMKTDYDDSLFRKALDFLKRSHQENKVNPTGHQKHYSVKEESNITQATPQFFLGKGSGIKRFCHRWDIFPKKFDNNLWNRRETHDKLQRLYGLINNTNGYNTYIVFQNKQSGESIYITKVRGTDHVQGLLSEEEVSFFLGFSIAGPIAYNVKMKRYEKFNNERSDIQSKAISAERFKVENYKKEGIDELKKKLRKIMELKRKRPSHIHIREKQLMDDEDDIKEALVQLEESSEEFDITSCI